MKRNEQAKQLYLSGKTEQEIATILNVSLRTIQNYKTKSADDWVAAKMSEALSEDNIKQKEQEFLLILIHGFEDTFNSIKELAVADIETAEKKLALFERYTKAYWSIKNPKQKDEKVLKLTVALDTIKKISDIAIDTNDLAVVNFLADNSDKIISDVSK